MLANNTYASGAPSDDAIVLSPFEVNTSKDRGFTAVNAGTATKLGLDLKDLAAPYSVMTGEFIRAMGITDIRSAVFWSTGGSQVFDGQGSDPFGLNGANTVTTSTMYSIRGQTLNAGQQRNFFLTGSMGDTYNIERIDFGRGPNAVLFNVGANNALGGGISTQGKRARLDDDFANIGTLVGSWDYYRATIDVNKQLTDNLAVRANLMGQKRGGWMEDEFEDRSGATLAATYRLAPRTELRIEGIYDTAQRATVPFPYFDLLSGWNGSTYFSGPLSEQIMSGAAPTANGAFLETRPGVNTYQAGSREGIARVTSPQYIWDPATNTLQNWIHTATTRRGDENEWVPFYLGNTVFDRAGNNSILPFGNSNANGAGNRTPAVNQNGGQAAFLDMINLPDSRFDRQVANSKFTVPGRRFSAMPDMPLYTQRWNDVNMNLTHAFTDNLFVEFAGDWNRLYEGASNAHLNLRFGLIDLNETKPDGSANPNFKKAYSQTNNGLQFNYRTMTNWGMRANLGYIK
ncbi:MAG TPA: TonB-dependent receptor plug domain-containing protein, partial [Opitutus sp.]|nr:TonB-dependent receptor plug domain-containing protein [Opitutus sp.]